MADFVSLTCSACNGKLQIGKDLERFASGYTAARNLWSTAAAGLSRCRQWWRG